ncbi:tetratricopeptide repeat protein [bacterium]|nr:tetratricopeptide repeat protein [bacterium]MCP5462356.1 tetratricopeptide repeat protein [bacterium]
MKLKRILRGIIHFCLTGTVLIHAQEDNGEYSKYDSIPSFENIQLALAENPESSDLYYYLALRNLEKGNVQQAFVSIIDALKHVQKVETNPQKYSDFLGDDKENYSNCVHLLDLKMEQEAYDGFLNLLEKYPHSPEILFNLSVIDANRGEYALFFERLYHAAHYNFPCKEYKRIVGAIHVLLGDIKEAEILFGGILEEDNDFSPAYVWLGKMRLMEQKFDEALFLLRKAIKINPDDYVAHVTLARITMELGQFTEAEKLAKETIELNKTYWEGHHALALIYLNMDRFSESIERFKEVIVLRPNEIDPLADLANAYQIKGMYDEAIGVYKSIIHLQPELFQAYSNIADLYAATGNFKLASENLEKALILNPDSALLHYNFGMVSKKLLDFEKAKLHLKRAVALDSTYIDAYMALYYLYKNDLNNQKEAEHYQTMIELLDRQ